jgi:AcrR family transcriptional regulator
MTRAEQKMATRQKILAAALFLFQQQGFDATNTRQIAKQAGVAAGTVFSHFSDKFELLKALFLQQIETLLMQNAAKITPNTRALDFFSMQTLTLYQFYEKDREMSKSLLQNSLFDQAMFAQQLEQFVQKIAYFLQKDLPHISPDKNLLLAKSWFGFYFFELFSGISRPEYDAQHWHQQLMSQCQSLFEFFDTATP